jgi:L-aspartate oxidase
MWSKVGIVRSGESLAEACEMLVRWQASVQSPAMDRASWETANAVLVSRLMAEAALTREESRGSHYRTDFPEESDAWRRHVVLTRSVR